ncbi:hypothetical protein TRIUR3_23405 [Triticum urartu]|uniref:Uncharacterized protein n=2 Tax=Triticum TaxID=4564 RepID=A0A9R1NZB5_TRITD|nr:hypothetical protein TRIUR3_23405 [Triticum urartu]VAH33813.1 unnamed protein product [Triticum turgidum subsp. durum]
MGSTGATAVLLSCVVLSIVAAGSAASDKPLIISNAALLASPPEASSSSGRKLGGFMEAGLCPLQLEHLKQMGKGYNQVAKAPGYKEGPAQAIQL